MKHLKITYGDTVIFDGEVSEFSWQDSDGGVAVSGRTKPKGGGLLEILANARKDKVDADMEARQAEYRAELAGADNGHPQP